MAILLDTAVLLLWVVGSTSREAIAQFKRTSQFDTEHFKRLEALIGTSQRLVMTQAILTEASNHLGSRLDMHAALGPCVQAWAEAGSAVARVLGDPVFNRLGFADTVTLHVAAQGAHVITADARLYYELLVRRCAATNIWHG